jgi:hypothetical protein
MESVTGLEPKVIVNRIVKLIAATEAEDIPQIQEALTLIADGLLNYQKPSS